MPYGDLIDKPAHGGGVRVKTYLFSVELSQEEEGRRWSVWVPTLPGLTSWGHAKEEARRNIQDAAEAYLEDMVESGETVPLEAGKIDVIDRPAIAVTR
jgi:predicted RNase H-like HicB family nuclease